MLKNMKIGARLVLIGSCRLSGGRDVRVNRTTFSSGEEPQQVTAEFKIQERLETMNRQSKGRDGNGINGNRKLQLRGLEAFVVADSKATNS